MGIGCVWIRAMTIWRVDSRGPGFWSRRGSKHGRRPLGWERDCPFPTVLDRAFPAIFRGLWSELFRHLGRPFRRGLGKALVYSPNLRWSFESWRTIFWRTGRRVGCRLTVCRGGETVRGLGRMVSFDWGRSGGESLGGIRGVGDDRPTGLFACLGN